MTVLGTVRPRSSATLPKSDSVMHHSNASAVMGPTMLEELLSQALAAHHAEIASLRMELEFWRTGAGSAVGCGQCEPCEVREEHATPSPAYAQDEDRSRRDGRGEEEVEAEKALEENEERKDEEEKEEGNEQEENEKEEGQPSTLKRRMLYAKSSSSIASWHVRQRAHSIIFKSELSYHEPTRLEKFVSGPLDVCTSILIFLNIILMIALVEFSGYSIGVSAGFLAGQPLPDYVAFVLLVLEHSFNAFFVAELLIRIVVFRRRFLLDGHGRVLKYTLFDTFLICITAADLYLSGSGLKLDMLRPLRFLRPLRTLRALRAFGALRVLVNAVFASFLAMFWSMMLLTMVMLMAALYLCISLSPAIADESLDLETRTWIFNMYGTTARSFSSVFELTFSGGWPQYTRTVVDMEPAYFLFFGVYIIFVVFAMFRIITAVFLKETLVIASRDVELAVEEKIKKDRAYVDKLKSFFTAFDASEDGVLSEWEFRAVIEEDKVRAVLSLMGVDIRESREWFEELSGGCGYMTCDQFVQGISRMKGDARSQDVWFLRKSTDKMMQDMVEVQASCAEVKQALVGLRGPHLPTAAQALAGRTGAFTAEHAQGGEMKVAI